MKRIVADIKNQTFKNMYLIYGPERYLCRYYTNELAKALGDIKDEMNSSVFSGNKIDIPKIIDIAQTLPFFAPRRLIVIKDSGVFKSSNDMLAEYLKNPSEDTFFVFCEEEVDKRNKVYKTVLENGYVALMDKLSTDALEKWAAKYFADNGKKITGTNMRFFIESIGTDMDTIRNESDKIISYLGDREIIEREDIEEIVSVNITARIFDMTDCIAAGNVGGAMKVYADLIELKEAPESIMFSIIKMFKQLYEIKTFKGSADVAKTLGMNPYVVTKYTRVAKNFTKERLLEATNYGAQLVEDVRTGKMDKFMSVELFVIKYATR